MKKFQQRLRRNVACCLLAAMLVTVFSGFGETKVQAQTESATTGSCHAAFHVVSKWNNHIQGEIRIQNDSRTEAVEDWSIRFYLDGEIENIWNGTVESHADTYVVKNAGYNQDIPAGGSVAVGMIINTEHSGDGSYEVPTNILLNDTCYQAVQGVDITYNPLTEYENKVQGEITIKNNTGKKIEDWKLDLSANVAFQQVWNASLSGEQEAPGFHTLENSGYNQNIEPGQTVHIGFIAEKEANTAQIADFALYALYASESCQATGCPGTTDTPQMTVAPGTTGSPAATNTPELTPTPVVTAVPTSSGQPADTALPSLSPEPEESGDPEDFDPDEDFEIVNEVENQDWNMEMIHADSQAVEDAKKNPSGTVRVALLDSGVNFSEETDVTERKNFVPGEDDYSALFEDISGHGTSIADVLCANPNDLSFLYAPFPEGEEGEDYDYFGDTPAETEDLEEGEEPVETEEEEEDPEDTFSLMDLLDSGYEFNEGVNPNIDLISARVLDSNNETTPERVAEAVDWAIENESDILCLCFGMEEDSEVLHRAIRKAEENGILMIASAGNGEEVEYPAAYPEVMAVGSVNSLGEKAEQSPEGSQIEVVAPGEGIVSKGWMGSMQIYSGTSMAVPHVVGLASLLWQKDTGKSAKFIRELIDASANKKIGGGTCQQETYGYGLIDCENALNSYEEFETAYEKRNLEEKGVTKKNVNALRQKVGSEGEVKTDESMYKLTGRWVRSTHKIFVTKNVGQKVTNKGESLLRALKKGVTFVDEEENDICQGMKANPWFHGYHGEKKNGHVFSNYLYSYEYLMSLAGQMKRSNELSLRTGQNDMATEMKNAQNGINKAFVNKNKVGTQTWKTITELPSKKINRNHKALVIFGMALHTATDLYAHSTYACNGKEVPVKNEKLTWKRIDHKKAKPDAASGGEKVKYADNTQVVKKRYACARNVAKKVMGYLKFNTKKQTISIGDKACYPENIIPDKKTKKGKLLYDINDFIIKKDGINSCIKWKYFKNAFAIGRLRKYYEQFSHYVTINFRAYELGKDIQDEIDRLSKGGITDVTKDYIAVMARCKTDKNKKKKFKLYMYNGTTRKLLCASKETKADSFRFVIQKSVKYEITVKVGSGKETHLCGYNDKLIGPRADGFKKKLENTNLDATDEEEEEVSVCSAESAQMDYRITAQYLTSWDKKEVDLDTILVMTDLDLSDVTIVSHPEKYGKNAVRSLEGEVELSEDVTEGGGGMEAVSIYQYDPDKLYFLFVYKNSVALDSTFMRCGIHTSVWRNEAPMYQLDSNMEDSDNDVDDAGRLMLVSLIDGGYNSGVSDRFRGYDVDAYDVADILVEKLGIEY